MIRITGMTLSCMEIFRPSAEQLARLYGMLSSTVRTILKCRYMCTRRFSGKPGKIALRIGTPEELAGSPEPPVVCRMNGLLSSLVLPPGKIQMTTFRAELFPAKRYAAECPIVRAGRFLCHDYESAFSKLKSRVKERVEFCPKNSCLCATAAALDDKRRRTDLAFFFGAGRKSRTGGGHALRCVLSGGTGRMPRKISCPASPFCRGDHRCGYPDRKAVIGRTIFNVESGIHVDGILKKPQMYEPYLPELVGRHRRLIVGKHSGRKSIAAKLRELGYASADFDVAHLLSAVRAESVGTMTSLTDEEFKIIAERHRL
jgi:homocitrate synthase NifV